MAHYVVGDLQGCFDSFMALLQRLNYQPQSDRLYLAGDLVNRGPKSLDTLRWVLQGMTQGHVQAVLGNHDLHLLAQASGFGRLHASDTVSDILQAPDCAQLITGLRQLPLALELPPAPAHRRLLVHAGLLPQWNFDQALGLSAEVQAALQATDWTAFMAQLYGNHPNTWTDTLNGTDRLRLIVNVCTRMRMLNVDGSVDLKFKLEPADAPPHLKPWFDLPRSQAEGEIVFGHWSTLGQLRNAAGYCLDTGCVWGGQLTALCLDDGRVIQQPALEPPRPLEA